MTGNTCCRPALPEPGELERRYGPGSSRRRNLALVLQTLQRSGPLSRAELAAETKLNKAVVAAAVGDLVDWQLVVEHKVTHTGQTGRPSRPIAISGPWVHGLGIEIHGDRVAGLISDLAGDVKAAGDMPFPSGHDVSELGGDEVDAVVGRLVAGLVDGTHSQHRTLAGVCLSIPGQLQRPRVDGNPGDWMVAGAVAHLRGLLSSKYGLVPELRVERSAVVTAIAEQRLGAIAPDKAPDVDMIAISGDVAVTAGLLLDGRQVRSSSGLVGDVGHLIVDPGGSRCRCGGRGCWETVIGIQAILRECAPDLAGDPRRPPSLGEIDQVVERALYGELNVVEGLERIGYWLGIGIASLVAMIDPDVVLLSGYLAAIAPWTNESMRATIATHVTAPVHDDLTIEVSRLDRSASMFGASVVAAAPFLDDPVPVVSAASMKLHGSSPLVDAG